MRRYSHAFKAAALLALATATAFLTGAAGASTTTTPNGTWTAYPGSQTVNQTSVQQPINADGSSNFKSNGNAVIPVKFAISSGTGPFMFESIYSDNTSLNDGLGNVWYRIRRGSCQRLCVSELHSELNRDVQPDQGAVRRVRVHGW